MNKQEFINAVCDNTDLDISRKLTGEVINSTFTEIANILVEDQKFAYPGFGTFTKKARAARTGINPKTKEKIQIPARNTVSFKPASSWKPSIKL